MDCVAPLVLEIRMVIYTTDWIKKHSAFSESSLTTEDTKEFTKGTKNLKLEKLLFLLNAEC